MLFTADPVTGDRATTVINASWGLGEAVVGGRVTPDVVTVARGAVTDARTGDKTVMTVRTAAGTEDRPVPDELRRRPVLGDGQAVELAALGARVQELYGVPMDVEWARHDDAFAIVQARPITGLAPQLETWNDSLKGEYLWTAGNFGEAIPDVMTPITWSFVQLFIHEAMSASTFPGFDMVGNIGGRFYMNLTPVFAMVDAFRVKSWSSALEGVFGKIPPGLEIPKTKVFRWAVLRRAVPAAIGVRRRARKNLRGMRAFLAASPRRCEELRDRIAATTAAALAGLYATDVEPHFRTSCRMLEAAGRQGGTATGQDPLPAAQDGGRPRRRGDAHRRRRRRRARQPRPHHRPHAAGARRDHQGRLRPHVRAPRTTRVRAVGCPGPAKTPAGSPRSSTGLRDLRTDTAGLLARQERAREAAWARFAARYPRKTAAMRERVRRWGAVVRDRETARSECIRAFWVLRAFVVRAGALTGDGDDVFYLHVDELGDVLRGATAALARVPARRATYERYTALPPYPALIVGRFDPVALGRGSAAPHRPLRRPWRHGARERHRGGVPRRPRRGGGRRAGDRGRGAGRAAPAGRHPGDHGDERGVDAAVPPRRSRRDRPGRAALARFDRRSRARHPRRGRHRQRDHAAARRRPRPRRR